MVETTPNTQTKTKKSGLKMVVVIAMTFTALAGLIVALGFKEIVSIELMLLMLIGLLGLYLAFGIMAAVYRLISKLE
jgi:hypothetical protein